MTDFERVQGEHRGGGLAVYLVSGLTILLMLGHNCRLRLPVMLLPHTQPTFASVCVCVWQDLRPSVNRRHGVPAERGSTFDETGH